MRKLILISALLFSLTNSFCQVLEQKIVTTDIQNFWKAYDKIVTTRDSTLQYKYLNQFYINKRSRGLKKIMTLKNYTPKKYIDAINQYPLFWQSIRQNTNNVEQKIPDIELAINKLKTFYPELKKVPIYFTIGVFRTNGTAKGKDLLIGSEMALTDSKINYSELPENLHFYYSNFTKSFETIDLLCTHEYIHTLQKEIVENLLCASIYEGVAEFISTKILGKPSNSPAIEFGKQNKEKVKSKFEEDMFNPNKINNWLWGQNRNALKERDLGYYIGYSICEINYEMAENKNKAIKEMIGLDYNNDKQISTFADRTKFFSDSLKNLESKYEKSRPMIISISQFENGSQSVNPNLKQITLNFSTSMNKEIRGFDFGPLGEKVILMVKKVIGFSEDGKSFTYEVELKPNKRYQAMVTNRFIGTNGIPLKPFVIDVKTAVN